MMDVSLIIIEKGKLLKSEVVRFQSYFEAVFGIYFWFELRLLTLMYSLSKIK